MIQVESYVWVLNFDLVEISIDRIQVNDSSAVMSCLLHHEMSWAFCSEHVS